MCRTPFHCCVTWQGKMTLEDSTPCALKLIPGNPLPRPFVGLHYACLNTQQAPIDDGGVWSSVRFLAKIESHDYSMTFRCTYVEGWVACNFALMRSPTHAHIGALAQLSATNNDKHDSHLFRCSLDADDECHGGPNSSELSKTFARREGSLSSRVWLLFPAPFRESDPLILIGMPCSCACGGIASSGRRPTPC